MTSLAFVLGMVPLLVARGAGAASRIAVGTGVAGGVLAATVFGIFFIPLFYLAVRRWVSRRRPPSPHEIALHQSYEHAVPAVPHA
jgi:multidrug efflux pump